MSTVVSDVLVEPLRLLGAGQGPAAPLVVGHLRLQLVTLPEEKYEVQLGKKMKSSVPFRLK